MDALTLALSKKYTDSVLPCYEKTVKKELHITWDGSTKNREQLVEMFYKVSDTVVTYEELIGGSIKAIYNGALSDIPIAELRVTPYDEFDESAPMTLYSGELSLIMCFKKDGTFLEQNVTKGIYFVNVAIEGVSLCTTELYVPPVTEVKKLDEKFLPNGVGGLPTVEIFNLDKMILGATDEDTEREKGILITAIQTGKPFILKGHYILGGQETTVRVTTECVASVHTIAPNSVYMCSATMLSKSMTTEHLLIGVEDGNLGFSLTNNYHNKGDTT